MGRSFFEDGGFMVEAETQRVWDDLGLFAVCDQLTDEELGVLDTACSSECDEVPPQIAAELTEAAGALLKALFSTEKGRLQILDAVELEQHERKLLRENTEGE